MGWFSSSKEKKKKEEEKKAAEAAAAEAAAAAAAAATTTTAAAVPVEPAPSPATEQAPPAETASATGIANDVPPAETPPAEAIVGVPPTPPADVKAEDKPPQHADSGDVAATASVSSVSAPAPTPTTSVRLEPSPAPQRPPGAPPPKIIMAGQWHHHHHHHHNAAFGAHQHHHHHHHQGAFNPGWHQHQPPYIVIPPHNPTGHSRSGSNTNAPPPGVIVKLPPNRPPAKIIVVPPSAPQQGSVPASPRESEIPKASSDLVVESQVESNVPSTSPPVVGQPPVPPPASTVAPPAAQTIIPPPQPAISADSDDSGPDFVEDDEPVPETKPTTAPLVATPAVNPVAPLVEQNTVVSTPAPAPATPLVVATPVVRPKTPPLTAPSNDSIAATESQLQEDVKEDKVLQPAAKPNIRNKPDRTPLVKPMAKTFNVSQDETVVVHSSPPQSPEKDLSRTQQDTGVMKTWAKERLSRLFCPQQYHGRITKIHGIRPRCSRPPPLTSDFAVAAYTVSDQAEAQHLMDRGFDGLVGDGSQMFSTQLQLDARKSRRGLTSGRTTTFAICEIPIKGLRFAETLQDALAITDQGSPCFVCDACAYSVPRLTGVKVHALVDVSWTPFSDDDPPTCPIHGIPLQLFDPAERTLICALCSANDARRGQCVVLNDLFAGNSLRNMQHSLTDNVNEVERRLSHLIKQQAAAASSSQRLRQAVQLQFTLVQSALDAKKQELLSIIDSEERDRTSKSVRQIYNDTEIKRHLTASLSHLREIDGVKDQVRAFAQMGTVISSLGQLPPEILMPPATSDTHLKVNLEHVVRTITDVGFAPRGRKPESFREPVQSPPRRASPPRRLDLEAPLAKTITRNAISSPVKDHPIGANGSLLFDTDLSDMIQKHQAVEWKLRIDDPGSWIGLGVIVGDSFESLQQRPLDSRHLWIAPTNVPRVVKLKVSVGPHRQAKLTIHDASGRQLDDNRIAHWNLNRKAFPLVSFGAVTGSVTMLEAPRIAFSATR